MKAILINEYGDTDQLVIRDIPTPSPSADEVLIEVKAFGINRAEIYMRQGLWGDVAKVSGIECVGEIAQAPSGAFRKGQKVAAIMGGMGRTRNGSYAQMTCLPAGNVFALDTQMKWSDLAAIPESYATAWSCLFGNMNIAPGQTVFIRGGTSALGQAAINIASNIPDVTVISSTRNTQSADFLKQIGCADVLIEGPDLHKTMRKKFLQGIDAVMDIVGNTTLLDSLQMVKKGGTVCNAGFLGGGDPISFNPLLDMPSSVNLNFFASFMLGTEGYPLSQIPMQTIIERAATGIYRAKPARVFRFDDISSAHQLMEANGATGKIVVEL